MVSIIIPLKKDQGYLKRCVDACLKQDVDIEIEIIILPDESLDWNDPRVRIEATGFVSPARKRNRGVELSKGEILAFIDDDTRPQSGWLEAALVHFKDPKIGAVGGPSITPSDDPFWAQVSGTVYESWVMSGAERLRYTPLRQRDVDDFPSCNLLVRRSVYEEIGGFGTDFWPGEDTEFCLALTRKGYRIRYEPKALILHHRRPSLRRHFIQLANYGLHRGYFVKRFPETSRRLPYFVPSLAVIIGVVTLGLALFGSILAQSIFLGLFALYTLLVLLSLSSVSPRLILPSFCVIFISHCIYGISFLRGLLSPRLAEEDSDSIKKET
jgi:cellulose synthase/poly-beta-1,6-N-acetylglucosamine synthase-like glycosyltransferase